MVATIIAILGFVVFTALLPTHFAEAVDVFLLEGVRNIKSDLLHVALATPAFLGSVELTVPAIFVLSAWFYWKNENRKAYLCLATLLIVTGAEFLLKNTLPHPKPSDFFRKDFPVDIPAFTIPTKYSFPSGHALRLSMVIGLLWSWIGLFRRPFLTVAGAVLILLNSFSLVYYGFHWVSDVVGGVWLAAVAVAVAAQLERSKARTAGVRAFRQVPTTPYSSEKALRGRIHREKGRDPYGSTTTGA
jgi:membrane-associated phospholipid phosphatase